MTTKSVPTEIAPYNPAGDEDVKNEVATLQPAPAAGQFVGDVDEADFKIPYLVAVNPLSPLATEDNYPVGSLMLDAQHVLTEGTDKGPRMNLYCIAAAKQFIENVPFGADNLPDIQYSINSVIANGGHVKGAYGKVNGDPNGPQYAPALSMTVLVQTDASVATALPAPDGNHYALARLNLRKQAYSRSGKRLISAFTACKGDTLASCFSVSTSKNSFKNHTWFEVDVKMETRTSDEMKAWVKDIHSQYFGG